MNITGSKKCFAFFSLLISLTTFLASLSSGENGGHKGDGGVTVGNAGDWRRIVLGQAQRESANWVNTAALNIELFDSDDQLDKNSLVYRFVKSRSLLQALASDIIASEHIYKDSSDQPLGEYTTCAWTNDPRNPSLNDIVFSLKLCEIGLAEGGQAFANRLIIHESIHHLLREEDLRESIGAVFEGSQEQQAQKEDQFCDDVALAIHRLFELVVRNGKPHWRDIKTPYFTRDGKTHTFEPRGFHATAWTGPTDDAEIRNRLLVWGGCRDGQDSVYACGGNQYFNDGAIYDEANNSWTEMDSINAPSPRAEAQSVWTGANAGDTLKNLLFIWGGCRGGDGCSLDLGDGGHYDLRRNRWTAIPASDEAPSPRVRHSMVWSGTKLIVWGGEAKNHDTNSIPNVLSDGGLYNPHTNTWTPIPSTDPNTPTPRSHHFAVWTGQTGNTATANKMLIFGGCAKSFADYCSEIRPDGFLFDPETMTWSNLVTSGEPYLPRHNGSFVHVPSQNRILMFGGLDSDGNVISQGMVLDLKTLQIHKIAAMSAGRFKHRAVWAGDKMLVFGGLSNPHSDAFASSVLGYFPGAPGTTSPGTWREFKTEEISPLTSIESSAVWTGKSMLVWGGQVNKSRFTNYGSEFFTGW